VSYFERLGGGPDCAVLPGLPGRGTDVDALVRSVKHHLKWLLNSRQGCSQSSPDLGLTDFNDAVSGVGDLMVRIAGNIRETVEKFEPRIQMCDVHHRPDSLTPLDLSFRLVCHLPVGGRQAQFEIDLVMNRHDLRYRVS
jgi:type VI secretion system protein